MLNISLPPGWRQYKSDIIDLFDDVGDIRQIKEKFGALRVYGKIKDQAKLTEIASKCSSTCMHCGSVEVFPTRIGPWYGPRCERCTDLYLKGSL